MEPHARYTRSWHKEEDTTPDTLVAGTRRRTMASSLLSIFLCAVEIRTDALTEFSPPILMELKNNHISLETGRRGFPCYSLYRTPLRA